jgi:hypothetical protein
MLMQSSAVHASVYGITQNQTCLKGRCHADTNHLHFILGGGGSELRVRAQKLVYKLLYLY